VQNELAVDLEIAERQILQVVETAEPRAEVVERERASEGREPVCELTCGAEVGDGRGLGDFEGELGRVDAWRLGEALLDELQEAGVSHRDA
jgi:hypothetical protein